MDPKEKIINAFKSAGKPLRPGEVAELAGLDKTETEKLIKKMKDEGTLTSPKRCFYDINK